MKTTDKKTKNKKSKKKSKKIILSKGLSITLKVLIGAVILVGTIGVGLLAGVTVGCVITTKPITKDQLYPSEHVSRLYDTDGRVMLELTGSSTVNREWLSIDTIPKNLQNAFIAIEDERFHTHNGVDLKRTVSAVLGFFVGSDGSHGGSTITQQVVKNVTMDDARSVPRKIREQWRAIQLEQDFDKDKILEVYLNIIYFANNSYGAEVAARTYFNKSASELNLAECAFLAGIPNSPRKYNPATTNGRANAYKRQIIILDAMLEQGYIKQEEYIDAIQTELEFHIGEESDSNDSASDVYTYFEDAVIMQVRDDLMDAGYTKTEANDLIFNSGIQIYTTQDTEIQKIVDEIYCNPEYFKINIGKDPEDCRQSAVTVLDHNTGRVVALYGGYGEKTQSLTYNRATDAKRQPGSAIKPILVYAPLIDQNKLTAGTAIDEMPAHLDPQNPDRIWPSNWDKKVHGMINARYALAYSYNIPSATWFKDNINTCLSYLKNSGIDRTKEAYISTALGGLNEGVSTMELAAAYGTIANGGKYYEPILYTKVLDREGNLLLEDKSFNPYTVVYKESTAAITTSLMETVISINSTNNYLQLKKSDGTIIPTAAKTGSTNDLKDYWLAGFTAHYTAAVWYGDDGSAPMDESQEASTARILWKAVMQKIHENLEVKDFPENGDLVTVEICSSTGKRATSVCKADPRAEKWVYGEIYLKGTEPASDDYCNVHVQRNICTSGRDAFGKYYLATSGCTSTQLVTGTLRESLPDDILEYDETMYPTDWGYELSHEYCPNHSAVVATPEPEPDFNPAPDSEENTDGTKEDTSEASPTGEASTEAPNTDAPPATGEPTAPAA